MDLFQQLRISKKRGDRGMFFYKNDPLYPDEVQQKRLERMGYKMVITSAPTMVEVQDESEFTPYCTVYFYPEEDKKRYNL